MVVVYISTGTLGAIIYALVVAFLFVAWYAYRKGEQHANDPIEDDPCGNDNIKPRKPQDYL